MVHIYKYEDTIISQISALSRVALINLLSSVALIRGQQLVE